MKKYKINKSIYFLFTLLRFLLAHSYFLFFSKFSRFSRICSITFLFKLFLCPFLIFYLFVSFQIILIFVFILFYKKDDNLPKKCAKFDRLIETWIELLALLSFESLQIFLYSTSCSIHS